MSLRGERVRKLLDNLEGVDLAETLTILTAALLVVARHAGFTDAEISERMATAMDRVPPEVTSGVQN